MKILIVLTGGISTDGITSAWVNLCYEWAKHNDGSSDSIDFLDIENLSDNNVVARIKKLGYGLIPVKSRGADLIGYVCELARILKNNCYDIIHVNGSSSLMVIELLMARLYGVKIRIAHSHNTRCSHNKLHRLLTPLFNSVVTTRLACSKAAANWLFKNKKARIYHNGINISKFSYNSEIRDRIRTELGLQVNELAFGHVGKFNEQKNHRFLIDVFKEIRLINSNSRLFLYGDGPLFDDTLSYVQRQRLSDSVCFMGCVENIDEYIQGMDVMLLPSLYEGLPNVVVEWQASGVPSVVSDSITSECDVSGLVRFLSLKASLQEWARSAIAMTDIIKDRETLSLETSKKLKEAGFDIQLQSVILKQLYRDSDK